MSDLTRRQSFGAAALLTGLAATAARAAPLEPSAALAKRVAEAAPISADERKARMAKLQGLLQQAGVGGLLVESGSALEYFTGVQWHRSERTTAALIPAEGPTIVVTPAFEEPSVRETLNVPAEVWPWNEADSPFALLAKAASGAKVLAVEGTTRFYIADGVRRAANGALEITPGDRFVNACRMIKSPAELALMQVANDVTIEALRQVHAQTQVGMSSHDLAALMNTATAKMGAAPEFSLVLLNEASAYPHGSHQLQTVREGGVILMDCGCTVHGYQSDISRSWVQGEPSALQRKVWNTVKRGQEIALETAKLGAPTGALDDAVRTYYESEGWGPGYKLPGLSHRTGHGIGLDGHEPSYLVHGDATPLQPGMCFSDEPGIYIPGSFGIRLEDCWHMTETGPKLFTPLARSIEQPI